MLLHHLMDKLCFLRFCFEYLKANRPILAIAPPDGDLAEILDTTKAGKVVDFNDEETLKKNILEMYLAYKNHNLVVRSNNIDQYHRKNLTGQLAEIIKTLGTIIWNGPMGVFEFENYAGGTKAVAQAVADATANGAFSLIGGGDSVAAVNKFGYSEKVSYISTGGGAMLEFLEGKTLPGVAALR